MKDEKCVCVVIFRQIDPEEVKTKAESFFENCLKRHSDNRDYDVQVGQLHCVDVDQVYKAGMYELQFTLKFVTNNKYIFLRKVTGDWCNTTINELSNLWLSILGTMSEDLKYFHTDVEVKEMSFGTMPTMHHFAQNYHYITKISMLDVSIKITFDHMQRKMLLYGNFCSQNCYQCGRFKNRAFKFEVNYRSVCRIVIDESSTRDIVLYLVLSSLPLVYQEKCTMGQVLTSDAVCEQECFLKYWERTMDFGCTSNKSACNIQRIGHCNVLKIILLPRPKAYAIIKRLASRCATTIYTVYTSIRTIFEHREKLAKFELFPHDDDWLRIHMDPNKAMDVKFFCQYSWNVANGRSDEIKDQLLVKYNTEDLIESDHLGFLQRSLRIYSRNDEALCSALHHIADIISRCDIFDFEEALKILFDHYAKNPQKVDTPTGICLVRRVILTPSKMICLPPSEHFDNRIIRKYGSEHMLRVSVQDDNFSKLTFAAQSSRGSFTKKVIQNKLFKIDIGVRTYDFFAASNSQLREHGIWMFSKDFNGNTAASIRKWMGNFSGIRNVAKFMARMGQCFSTSEEAVQIEIKEEEILRIEDIKTEDGKYTFSDGIGMISTELCAEVRQLLESNVPLTVGHETDRYQASCFQIRFKGCKGMVAENPLLEGRKLVIRESMEKFPCKSSNILEVVKISAPRNLFLNRPLICILEQLGVNQNVFLKLQKSMVVDLTDSLIYERKARTMLTNLTSLDYPYKRLLKCGICLSQEPYFRTLLLSVYKTAIDLLRTKARIAIPPEYGRNLLGVLDETGTLEYGQVFIQISKVVGNVTSPTRIFERTVVVTKNPCMHPGDVRKFEAVDVPGLHHIKDCIVFPSKGKRPHPDEMAGSDLDGDEYVAIFLSDLEFEKNCKPMDYPASIEKKHENTIEVDDMIQFFCQYIENDRVGQLANAHLAWADVSDAGIFSERCLAIARKYPLALDFAKSGTSMSLAQEERPAHFPDFMEKGTSKNSYKSSKVLGVLYRVTRNLESCVGLIGTQAEEVNVDPHLEYEGWKEYADGAKILKDKYTMRVGNILKKYGLRNDCEVLSGYISKTSEYIDNRYERDNILSLSRSYLLDAIKRYKVKFLKAWEEEKRMLSDDEAIQVKFKRASAWYMVTYLESKSSALSFPWILSDILCDIREHNLRTKNIVLPAMDDTYSSYIESSDKELLETFLPCENFHEQGCRCVQVLHMTVKDFMAKSALIELKCYYCSDRVIEHFKNERNRPCCAVSQNHCNCTRSCSPTSLILDFMSFYALKVTVDIGKCTGGGSDWKECKGFRDLNLQSIALRSYASLAITRDRRHFGFHSDSNVELVWDNFNSEGDPIRIAASKLLRELMGMHHVAVENCLAEITGCRRVIFDGTEDLNKNCYFLVQIIGPPHARFHAEELVMDVNLPSIIAEKLGLKLEDYKIE